jgi:acyl-CoA-binding protein
VKGKSKETAENEYIALIKSTFNKYNVTINF